VLLVPRKASPPRLRTTTNYKSIKPFLLAQLPVAIITDCGAEV